MSYRICKSFVHFSVWTTFCLSSLPVFAQTTTTGSTSSSTAGWTPANWIALITAIGSIIVAVIGALKGAAAQKAADTNASRLDGHDNQISNAMQTGSAAQSKADSNEQRLNAVSARLNAHGDQITTLAQNQIPSSLVSQMQMVRPLVEENGKK